MPVFSVLGYDLNPVHLYSIHAFSTSMVLQMQMTVAPCVYVEVFPWCSEKKKVSLIQPAMHSFPKSQPQLSGRDCLSESQME